MNIESFTLAIRQEQETGTGLKHCHESSISVSTGLAAGSPRRLILRTPHPWISHFLMGSLIFSISQRSVLKSFRFKTPLIHMMENSALTKFYPYVSKARFSWQRVELITGLCSWHIYHLLYGPWNATPFPVPVLCPLLQAAILVFHMQIFVPRFSCM